MGYAYWTRSLEHGVQGVVWIHQKTEKPLDGMKSGLVIVGRGVVFFLFKDTHHSVIKVMYLSYLA